MKQFVIGWIAGFLIGFTVRGVLDRAGIKHFLSDDEEEK